MLSPRLSEATCDVFASHEDGVALIPMFDSNKLRDDGFEHIVDQVVVRASNTNVRLHQIGLPNEACVRENRGSGLRGAIDKCVEVRCKIKTKRK